jgi:hypothetical protein
MEKTFETNDVHTEDETIYFVARVKNPMTGKL